MGNIKDAYIIRTYDNGKPVQVRSSFETEVEALREALKIANEDNNKTAIVECVQYRNGIAEIFVPDSR